MQSNAVAPLHSRLTCVLRIALPYHRIPYVLLPCNICLIIDVSFLSQHDTRFHRSRKADDFLVRFHRFFFFPLSSPELQASFQKHGPSIIAAYLFISFQRGTVMDDRLILLWRSIGYYYTQTLVLIERGFFFSTRDIEI